MLAELRRAVGHSRLRRPTAGMCLRPLHRHGLLPQLRRCEPADLQPQLRGPQRHGRRQGVSGVARKPPWPPPSPGRSPIPAILGLDALHDGSAGPLSHRRQRCAGPCLPGRGSPCWNVLRGPNIKEFPQGKPVGDTITAKLTLKVGRQHHHRPHHARRRQDPPLPLQHPQAVGVLLRRVRQGVRQKRQGSRRDAF